MTVESIDFSKFKYCDCGCNELIPIINKLGKFARYKHGHHINVNNPTKSHEFTRNKHWNWKGGRILDSSGYWLILRSHHSFANFDGYVFEHRYFMELQLGRYLTRKEVVHHIDGNKQNNELSNLMLYENNGNHLSDTLKKDMSNRYCLLCNGKTYIDKNGFECWIKYQDGFICKKCCEKERRKKRI